MTLGRSIMLSIWGFFILPMTVAVLALILHPDGGLFFGMDSRNELLPNLAVEALLITLVVNVSFFIGYKQVGKYEDRKKAAAEKEIAATKRTQGGK